MTREELLNIIETDHVQCGEAAALARMALAFYEWHDKTAWVQTDKRFDILKPVAWINGCNKSVPAALRYLAENPRPIGGESSFNTAHLYQLAREIESMSSVSLYRHGQQPVVPDEMTIRDACKFVQDMRVFDDVVVIVMRTWNACRAAMLAAAPQEINHVRK